MHFVPFSSVVFFHSLETWSRLENPLCSRPRHATCHVDVKNIKKESTVNDGKSMKMAKGTAGTMNMVGTVLSEIPAKTIDIFQWINIIQYLDLKDFKYLRLASRKYQYYSTTRYSLCICR
jgi:hypothetical protein